VHLYPQKAKILLNRVEFFFQNGLCRVFKYPFSYADLINVNLPPGHVDSKNKSYSEKPNF
jgi:hypothetical protein